MAESKKPAAQTGQSKKATKDSASHTQAGAATSQSSRASGKTGTSAGKTSTTGKKSSTRDEAAAKTGKSSAAKAKEPSASKKEPSAPKKQPSAQKKEPSAPKKEPAAPAKKPAAKRTKASSTAKPSAASATKAKPSVAPPSGLASQLLEMHLQHELTRFQDEQFLRDVHDEVVALLARLKQVSLREWVTPEQVMGVIQRDVIDLKIAGGIAELAGDMANQVYLSEAHREAKLREIMSAKQLELFVEKLLSLQTQRQRMVRRALDHPLYADLISHILYEGIVHYLANNNLLSGKLAGMSSMWKFGKKMVDKAVPTLEGGLESSLKTFIAKNVRFFIGRSESFLEHSLSEDMIRDGIMDFWETIENKPLKSFQQGMEPIDLSEFVALGYEFWLKFRRTEYFKSACRTVVDAFYAEYGDEPLSVLLDDVGVSELMIEKEFEAFAPRILASLRESGYLEERLRHRLEKFYFSDQVVGLLNSQG